MANYLIPDHVKGYIKVPRKTEIVPDQSGDDLNGYYEFTGAGQMVFVEDDEAKTRTIDLTAYQDEEYFRYRLHNVQDALILIYDAADNILHREPISGTNGVIEIPEDAAKILFPYDVRWMETGGDAYYLGVEVWDSTDVTKWITNWSDLAVKMERDALSGVFLDVEMPLSLYRNGADMIRDMFMTDGLYARANFAIWRRENLGFNYTLVNESPLNFATYSENDDVVEISAERRNFNSLVSSFGRTKYDILAKDVSVGKWEYEHNQVLAGGDWTIAEAEQTLFGVGDNFNDAVTTQTISINLDDSSVPFNGALNDIKSQSLEGVVAGNDAMPGKTPDEYFLKVDPYYEDRFKLNLKFKFRLSWPVLVPTGNMASLFLGYEAKDGTFWTMERWPMDDGNSYIDLDYSKTGVSIPAGAKLKMFIYYAGITLGETFTYAIENFEYFTIRYLDQSERTESWDVATLESVANRLLTLMGRDFGKKYTAVVNVPESFYNGPVMLCAAETIRGYGDKANFHTSFTDFLEFMQFIGCEYSVDEESGVVTFSPRDTFFDPTVTALTLSEGETAGLMVRADDEYAFSSAKIGYERPDIETINGKFAPHGAHEYTLGYQGADFERQQLEIMSPYKTDPVELEVLSWSQPSKDKDNKSDNDLFAVAMVDNGDGTYSEFRGYQYRIDGDFGLQLSLFNAPFSPRRIAEVNRNKIGINAKVMNFAGTDAYRYATFDDSAMGTPYDDVDVPGGLFSPIIYEFEAGTHLDLPDPGSRRGLVVFSYHGRQYQGYVKEMIKNYCYEQSTTWQLFGKKV
jgi:hypothetical protein